MDGVSAAASIFALVQAGEALGKTLKFLWSLRKVPEEIVTLADELLALQGIANALTQTLQNRQLDPTVPGCPSSSLTVIKKRAADLETSVRELDTICARCKRSTASEDETQNADSTSQSTQPKKKQLHGSRKKVRLVFDWLLEKNNIEEIRQRINKAKDDLSLHLHILNTATVETVSQMSLQRLQTTSQINNTTQARQMALDEVRRQMLVLLQGMQAVQTTEQQSQIPPSRQLQEPQANPSSTLVENFIAFSRCCKRLSYRRRPCSAKSCPCHCHATTYRRLSRYQSVAKLLGYGSIKYTNLPYTSRAPCDIESCRRPASTLHIDYTPPQWLFCQRLILSASWGGLAGVGASLRVHVPVLLPNSVNRAIRKAAQQSDLRYFQDAVASKTIIPSHVDEYGWNMIYSLVLLSSAKEEIILFLVDQGFPISTLTYNGASVSGMIRKIDKVKRYSELAIIAAEEEQPLTTELHDFLFGLTPEPFASILDSDPSSMKKLDLMGETPMHYAIEHNKHDLLKLMLDHPACDINRRNGDGEHLLHYAAKCSHPGSTEMVSLILNHRDHVNANVDVDSTFCEFNYVSNPTPLCLAMYNPETVKLLLAHCARVTCNVSRPVRITYPFNSLSEDVKMQRFKEFIRILMEAGLDLEAADNNNGRTTLLSWALVGEFDHVRALIECGARADAVGNDGENVLHFVARFESLSVEYLYSHADLFADVDVDAVNLKGETPLDMWEAYRQHPKNDAWDDFPKFLERVRELRALRQVKTGVVEEIGTDGEETSDGDDEFDDALEEL